MPDATPLNDLERALAGALKSAAGRPAFFQQLRAGEISFLMPFHPEMQGSMPIVGGAPISLVSWKNPEGLEVVPLFTCPERVEESLQAQNKLDAAYCVATAPALLVLQMLAARNSTAILNPACSTGEVFLDPPSLAAVADGSVLRPLRDDPDPGPGSENVVILDPADYPTDFIQPAFEFMRQHRAFRGAWIFGLGQTGQRQFQHYKMALYVEPDDRDLIQQLGVVITALNTPERDCTFLLLDPAIPNNLGIMENVPAFHMAADYERPGRGLDVGHDEEAAGG